MSSEQGRRRDGKWNKFPPKRLVSVLVEDIKEIYIKEITG